MRRRERSEISSASPIWGTRVRCDAVIEDVVRPRGPYRLHLMTYGRAFETPLPGGGRGQAWQRTDGQVICARPTRSGSSSCASCSRSTPTRPSSCSRFRHDPLLGPSIRHLHGLRPLRRADGCPGASCAAICGQLIEARRALAIERAIVRACGEPAPTRETIAALSPAQLRRLGLATHRASTLVRVCRTIDLEGLRGQPVEAVAARLLRERGPRSLVARDRSRCRVWAATGTGSSATSASSSSARRFAAAGSSSTRPPSCSSRTASGRGWRASTSWPAGAAGSSPARARTSRGSSARARLDRGLGSLSCASATTRRSI